CPDVGASSPAASRSNVVLPEPFRPMSPVRPALNAPDTAFSAVVPSGQVNVRWSNVRAVKEGLLRSVRETLITGPCPAATGERLPLGSGRHDDQRGSRVGVGVPHRSTRFDGRQDSYTVTMARAAARTLFGRDPQWVGRCGCGSAFAARV